MGVRNIAIAAALLAMPLAAWSQSPANPDLKQILERLDRLERENESLRAEVRALRREVSGLRPPAAPRNETAPAPPSIEDRLAIQQARVGEHEQVKVSASQRFPLRITGMALFNLFGNGALSGGTQNPVLATAQPGDRAWGGTLRQSILGLEYDGPGTAWGGKVRGSLYMDFFAGSSQTLYNLFRIRTGSIEVGWKSRSLMVGQEKPLFAPRNPTSYSQVGVLPLTAAGNLWRWQPQVRFEQRLGLGRGSGLRAQLGFIQTSEDLASAYSGTGPRSGAYGSGVLADEHRRPGLEGRLELWHAIDENRRIEFAPGFHYSKSHVLGNTLPSDLFSLDWLLKPLSRLEFTGAFFSGQNIDHFGAPHAGFTVLGGGRVIGVHSRGGWAQFTIVATDRLSFNIYGGEHDDRNADLLPGDVGLNRAGAANLVYRLGPNVLLSLEALQVRTSYLGAGPRLNNHYDLALAYLF